MTAECFLDVRPKVGHSVPSLRAKRSNPGADAWTIAAPALDCFVPRIKSGVLAMASAGGFMKAPCVYMMASERNGTVYTGVTSNLPKRAYQHRNKLVPGFTSHYGCTLLVWYEYYERIEDAIAREKQIKAGSRKRKLELIETVNPQWRDLYEELAQ
jgi:predicted GIY-YIG superfamily endonuclease